MGCKLLLTFEKGGNMPNFVSRALLLIVEAVDRPHTPSTSTERTLPEDPNSSTPPLIGSFPTRSANPV